MQLAITLVFWGFISLTPLAINGHALKDMGRCQQDSDCATQQMCHRGRGEPCECFHFSTDILGPRCVKLSWAYKLRARRDLALASHQRDIGPDTCGQDRKLLGKWFQSHGESGLISDPRPPLVNMPTEDPYADPANPPLQPDQIRGFCAMQWQDEVQNATGKRMYKLANFESETEAVEAGWNVTHRGQCGACSILQDLGVYISRNLTSETRRCGLEGTFLGQEHVFKCLKDLGFSDECSKVWQYNIAHTKEVCFGVCIWSWITNEPFNKPDGSLNDCIQCDEDKSGPNFKYFSGRTRRNSGIPSAIHRPPETIFNMTHCYWYGDLLY